MRLEHMADLKFTCRVAQVGARLIGDGERVASASDFGEQRPRKLIELRHSAQALSENIAASQGQLMIPESKFIIDSAHGSPPLAPCAQDAIALLHDFAVVRQGAHITTIKL